MEMLRNRLQKLVTDLQAKGRPARTELAAAVVDIKQWKNEQTLDDAMGHGLDLIHQYAEVAGMHVNHLGLLQTPELSCLPAGTWSQCCWG